MKEEIEVLEEDNNSQGGLSIKRKDIYTIRIYDEKGNYTGNDLEFNLSDINLVLKYNNAIEEIKKIKNHIKMQEIIINKRQDVPGEFLSKNQKDLHLLYSNAYKDMRKAMDKFLGKNGCQKIFGDIDYIEMFDDLIEWLKPEFEKMGLNMENIKNRIKEKYSTKKDNVI